MLRRILLALDDTEGAIAARDYAVALARHSGAALTAAVILDPADLGHAHEAVPPGAAAFKERRDAALLRQAQEAGALAVAGLREAAKEIPFTVEEFAEAPTPALLAAAGAHDLLIVGRDATLGREDAHEGLAPAIETLLRDRTRAHCWWCRQGRFLTQRRQPLLPMMGPQGPCVRCSFLPYWVLGAVPQHGC